MGLAARSRVQISCPCNRHTWRRMTKLGLPSHNDENSLWRRKYEVCSKAHLAQDLSLVCVQTACSAFPSRGSAGWPRGDHSQGRGELEGQSLLSLLVRVVEDIHLSRKSGTWNLESARLNDDLEVTLGIPNGSYSSWPCSTTALIHPPLYRLCAPERRWTSTSLPPCPKASVRWPAIQLSPRPTVQLLRD